MRLSGPSCMRVWNERSQRVETGAELRLFNLGSFVYSHVPFGAMSSTCCGAEFRVCSLLQEEKKKQKKCAFVNENGLNDFENR